MSAEQPEKWSPVWGDGSDPQSDVSHPNRLAPMLSDCQQDHDFEQDVTLPPLLPYIMMYHPQYTPAAQPYNLQVTNSAVAYPQHSFQSLVPAPTDRSPYQQLSPYYGHDHPQQYNQSSSSTADYPLPSLQQASPTFSNSPNERHALQSLSDSPAPQGSRSKSSATYETYEEKVAAVSGVVIPSKGPLGEMTQNPISKPSGRQHWSYLCPICGAAFSMEYKAKFHFAVCVARNGNPNGTRWHDGLHTDRSAQWGGWCHESKNTTKDTRLTLPDNQPDFSASQSSHSSPSPPYAPSARVKAMHDRLDAVNGVVIPSKLADGRVPTNLGSKARDGKTLNLFCPLCKGAFGKKDHVKSHFPACVKRNGNPDGRKWDDDLYSSTRH